MNMKIRLAVSLIALAAVAATADEGRWLGTWGASPQLAGVPLSVSGATIREFAHLSLGGDHLRLRLSNAYGAQPLSIGATHLALRAGGVAIDPASDRTVTFHGQAAVSIPAGGQEVSDPIDLTVPDLADVAISLYLPDTVALSTEHSLGVATTYLSQPGDYTATTSFTAAGTTQSVYLAADVEVAAPARAQAIVALGDSITDGYASTVDANHRWPNLLAARLVASKGLRPTSVVDEGISGNRVLHDFIGTNALARLDRDVLVKSGARYVIVLEGINDIGIPGAFGLTSEEVGAEDIIAGHQQIIRRARALGLTIYGATLTPFEGTAFPGYFTAAGEDKRQAVNAWIRGSGAYDGVIDFDAATRDPGHHARLLPAYDSGDHLHPNDAGYQAMANSVDLRLFR